MTKFEGLINSYIDAGVTLSGDQWEEWIRKEAEDLEQDISNEDVHEIIRILAEEKLVK